MTHEVLLRLELRCNTRAARTVRASLSCVEDIGSSRQELLLISSELVTNAVVHSGCDDRDLLAVCLSRGDSGYCLSVTDPGESGKSADLAADRAPGEGGLGMRIVAALADRWGQSRSGGYRVWAELAA